MMWAKIEDGDVVSLITCNDKPEGCVAVPEGLDPFRMKWNGSELVADDSSREAEFEIMMRLQRDQLLADSDWTQLPDVPLATKEAWATYRQALRDLPEHPNWPDLNEADWPVVLN
jgi:hypothetical protein